MSDFEKFQCPHCGSNNTARVQVVYESGRSTVTYNSYEVVGHDVEKTVRTYTDGHEETETKETPRYGFVTREKPTITDLARRIAPPSAPIEPVAPSDGLGCLGQVIVYIVLAGNISLYSSTWLMKTFNLGKGFEGGLMWFFLIAVAWCIWGCVFNYLAKIIKKKDPKYIREKQNYEQAMEDYKAKMMQYYNDCAIWEHSFICMRCGNCFYVDESA